MRNNNTDGFTLIELMVTMAVIAILGSVAMVSYRSSVTKAKRSEGKTALLMLMQQEEKFYTQNNSYIVFSKASTDASEKKFRWYSTDAANKSAYEIVATACTGDTIQNCVLLTATPGTTNVDSNFTDPDCGKLTLTSTGVKAIVTSGTGTKETCW
ncbi:MAG: type IV pilin protein [Burkholderiales bacterium]|nr:type IV pilin protein [Burkholderiales bacterium]